MKNRKYLIDKVESETKIPVHFVHVQLNAGHVLNQQTCLPEKTMLDQTNRSLKIEKIWFDSKTAAEYLCVSVPTLLNLVSSGQIPFWKFGRRNRYLKHELDSVLKRQRTE